MAWDSSRSVDDGDRALHIKVVDEKTSAAIGRRRALARSVATAALWILLLPGLIHGLRPLWNGKRQTWHDGAGKSVVVRLRTN